MKLKSLILQGFKSFYDRTVIEFHEGVTAVVGPNGSGKSNITDAIRWVLGEQSSKNLRVDKMDELIFAGTENKRALSFAEVTLVMDNSDHSIDIEYTEVHVTRRIYRNGESEYLLNNNVCRLKDITELFLDTGIGKDGYSMIGQGRVDSILSGRSDLRRKMLDEASGISKYKLRHQEASRKLEHTEQNLIRIKDILAEISKQKEPLESQAKKAHKYLNLREELKELDLAYLYYLIENQEKIQEDLEESIKSNAQNIELAETEKNKLLEESAARREQIQLLNHQISGLNNNLDENRSIMSNSKQALALYQQELHSITIINEEQVADKESANLRLKDIEKEVLKAKEFLSGINLEIDTTSNNFQEKSSKLSALESTSKNDIAEITACKSQLNEITAKISIAEKNLQNDLTNQEVLKQHKLILHKEEETLKNELADLENTFSKLNTDKTELNNVIQEIQNKLNELTIEQEQFENTLNTKITEANNIQNSLNESKYQLSTQESLQSSYEGYSYTVKNLMNRIKDSHTSVLGPLASLLKVPKEYETAISNALGASSQNIVVETEHDAQEMINILKKDKLGRATFLPINQIHANEIQDHLLDKVSRLKGYLGLASDVISYDNKIDNVVRYSLGRTVVADTLENAVNMAKSTGFKVRIVSLDGDLMNTGGSMSGGSNKSNNQTSSLLGRKRIISDLKLLISKYEKELNILSEGIQNSTLKFEKNKDELAGLKNSIDSEKDKLFEINLRIEQNQESIAKIDSQLAQNQSDLNHIAEQESTQSSDLNQKFAEMDVLKSNSKDIQEKLELLEANLEKRKAEQEDLFILKSQVEVQLAKLNEQKNSNELILKRLTAEQSELLNSIEKQNTTQQRNADRSIELDSLIVEENNKLTEKTSVEEKLLEQIEKLKADLELANKSIESSSENLNTVSSYLTKLGQEQGRLEQKLENNKTNLMDQRSKLWEEYNLTFADKDKWYRDDLDLDSTKTSIDKLRKQIKNLGEVNVQAIEESKSVNERYEFTLKQKEDVELAAKDLKELIKYLLDKMKTQFTDAFKFINEQFNTVFQELFAGGFAELSLNEENDILNSEINIIASPPGKKVQNILSLSGGERCLTAIALLFAIQKLNPAPFCVLDEVEAALDEANIFRFADYISRHSKETQYVLVTHRRGTMESANTIYGITMPERGVSKVISLNLDKNVQLAGLDLD